MKAKYTVWWTNTECPNNAPNLHVSNGRNTDMTEYGWVQCATGEVEVEVPPRNKATSVVVAAFEKKIREAEGQVQELCDKLQEFLALE